MAVTPTKVALQVEKLKEGVAAAVKKVEDVPVWQVALAAVGSAAVGYGLYRAAR